MNASFDSLVVTTLWVAALVLGGLAMFFAHLVERSGFTLRVSWATRAVFAIAAWGSWAMGAVAVVCAEAEIHTLLWWPVDPWALGLAALTIGLPLSSMYRCVQVQTDPLTWPV